MLEVLYESSGLPRFDIPEALSDAYGGSIGFDGPLVFANFVSSLDGVAALPDVERSSLLISARDPGDRFVMGLLRSCAEVVLIGAGTLRAHPSSRWTPDATDPERAPAFAEFRKRLGLPPKPMLAVATASGKIDLSHPGLAEGAVILTTKDGAATIGEPPSSVEIAALTGESRLDPRAILRDLRDRGYRSILTEGGPTLFGELLGADLIDELFLTMSNRFAGNGEHEPRPGIAEGSRFLPERIKDATLLSVRRSASHLLLRYAIGAARQR